MNFADYFTFEDYKEFYKTSQKIRNEPDLPKHYAELYDSLFGDAILKYMKDRQETYGFSSIVNAEGHITTVQSCLDKFFRGEELISYEARVVPMLFYKVVSQNMFNYKEEDETEQYFKNKYDRLIDQFNRGNFGKHELSEDSCLCYDCNQHFKMMMKDWKLSFNMLEYGEGYTSTVVAPKLCIDKNIAELSVVFKTGELLVADWFTIPPFAEYFSNSFEINTIKGRLESTYHHLERGNVLHLVLGNCSPTVFAKGNSLIVGQPIENEKEQGQKREQASEGYQEKGVVCTDLWAVTIVEKNQLVDIVTDSLFKNNNESGEKSDYQAHAEQKVEEDYLLEVSNGVTKVKVDTGQYKFSFHGNYNKFSENIADENIPQDIDPYMILEQLILDKVAKPKKSI